MSEELEETSGLTVEQPDADTRVQTSAPKASPRMVSHSLRPPSNDARGRSAPLRRGKLYSGAAVGSSPIMRFESLMGLACRRSARRTPRRELGFSQGFL